MYVHNVVWEDAVPGRCGAILRRTHQHRADQSTALAYPRQPGAYDADKG